MARHIVAKVDEIPAGGSLLAKVAGRDLGIFFVNGEYFALLNRCPHEGAPLARGRLCHLVEADEPGEFRLSRHGEILRCPWHGWEFDIRTGQSYCDPSSVFVRNFKVSVEPGSTLAKGPYAAEIFAVSVDDDYVVVDI